MSALIRNHDSDVSDSNLRIKHFLAAAGRRHRALDYFHQSIPFFSQCVRRIMRHDKLNQFDSFILLCTLVKGSSNTVV